MSDKSNVELKEQVRKLFIDNMTLMSYELSLDAIVQLIRSKQKEAIISELENFQWNDAHQYVNTRLGELRNYE